MLPEYEFTEESSNDKVLAAVTIDTEKAAIDVETDDFFLIEQTVFLRI